MRLQTKYSISQHDTNSSKSATTWSFLGICLLFTIFQYLRRQIEKTSPILFTSREAAWSCRTVGRKKNKKGTYGFFVNCSFIICPVLNFFANNDNSRKFWFKLNKFWILWSIQNFYKWNFLKMGNDISEFLFIFHISNLIWLANR